jgi:hypothetical protein
VQSHRKPVIAVSGDDFPQVTPLFEHSMVKKGHWIAGGEGAERRGIRKPESLPVSGFI